LFNNMLPILSGIAAGVVVGMASGILFTQLFRFSEELILTVLPKSLTTPVAMQVASNLGGIPSLAAVFVMVAGFTGYIFGPALLKWLHIDSPIGRGIGLGTSAHGMGTAKAFEYGQQEASDRKSTRLNSSHVKISYAVFCLKKKTQMSKLVDTAHTDRLNT